MNRALRDEIRRETSSDELRDDDAGHEKRHVVRKVGTQVSQMWLCWPSALRPDVGPAWSLSRATSTTPCMVVTSRCPVTDLVEQTRHTVESCCLILLSIWRCRQTDPTTPILGFLSPLYNGAGQVTAVYDLSYGLRSRPEPFFGRSKYG